MPKILVRGVSADVTDVVDHAPNTHPDSPIRNDLPAREWVTERGSRWSALHANGEPFHDPVQPRRETTSADLGVAQ